MIGKSYDGTLANGVAATGVRGLETIVPITSISSWYGYSRMNGVKYWTDEQPWLAGYVDTDPPEKCAAVRAELDEGEDDATGDYNAYWKTADYREGLILAGTDSDYNTETPTGARVSVDLRGSSVRIPVVAGADEPSAMIAPPEQGATWRGPSDVTLPVQEREFR